MKQPKILVNKTNMINPLDNSETISAVVESFVKVYGEEYRSRITNTITSTPYIFLPPLKAEGYTIPAFAYTTTASLVDTADIANLKKFKTIHKQVVRMMHKLYPKLDKNVNEWRESRITKIVECLFGEAQINNAMVRKGVELLNACLKPGFGINNTRSLEENLLRTISNFTDKNALQECFNMLDINLDCSTLYPISDFKDFEFSEQQLAAVSQLKDILYNDNLLKALQKIEDQYIYKLAEQDPFIIGSIEACCKGLDRQHCLWMFGDFVYNQADDSSAYYWHQVVDGELRGLIVCPDSAHLCDSTLIHETNHAIESNLILNSDIVKSGYNIHGKYRAFNEICNEYITQKVLVEFKTLQQNDSCIKLGLKPSSSNDYAVGIPFFSHFIEDNWDFILKSRTSVEPQFSLSNLIGDGGMGLLGDIGEFILSNYDYFVETEYLCESYYANFVNLNGKMPSSIQECSDIMKNLKESVAAGTNKEEVVKALMSITTYLSFELNKAVEQKFTNQADNNFSNDYNNAEADVMGV